jgi:hypothetical protein
MHTRSGSNWQKALRRIVRNPAVEVVAAIVVVMLAVWVVVQTESELRGTAFPLFFGHR